MKTVEELTREYLDKSNLLQIATCTNNTPWCCTVYFAHDEQLRIYWISKNHRRHSKEIDETGIAAGTIVQPHTHGDKVRGLQFSGTVERIPKESTDFMDTLSWYARKFSMKDDRQQRIKNDEDTHQLYCLTPTKLILFDELNFPDNPPQELVFPIC